MRRGSDNPQADFITGFSKVMSILTFKRRQHKTTGRMASGAQAGQATWTQTYWGRKFMKSV